jgi:hypothetical protein
MKNLAQRLIFRFSADCSQMMGLPPELKIKRFENFVFFSFFKISRHVCTKSNIVQNPKSKIK